MHSASSVHEFFEVEPFTTGFEKQYKVAGDRNFFLYTMKTMQVLFADLFIERWGGGGGSFFGITFSFKI